MTSNEKYNQAIELIDQAEYFFFNEVEQKTKKLIPAIEILDELYHSNFKDPDIVYSLAYAIYMMPYSVKDEKKRISLLLKEVIQLDSSNEFAKLYLGHYYFDRRWFKEALDYFGQVNESYFYPERYWRIIKNRELIFCCELALSEPYDVTILQQGIEFIDYANQPKFIPELALLHEIVTFSAFYFHKLIYNGDLSREYFKKLTSLMEATEVEVTKYNEEYKLFLEAAKYAR